MVTIYRVEICGFPKLKIFVISFLLVSKNFVIPPVYPHIIRQFLHPSIIRHSIIRLCRLSEKTIVESLRDTPPPFIPLLIDNQPLLFSFKYRLVYSSIISPFHPLMVENKVHVFFSLGGAVSGRCLLVNFSS